MTSPLVDGRMATSDDSIASKAPPPSSDNIPFIINKQDRKRLKKLRKKATNVINEGEHSGMLTQEDWFEMKRLMGGECSGIGPLVGRRKRKEANKVEASHHRDLLAWFMGRLRQPNGRLQQSRKRALSDEDPLQNPSIPSWASIHNPATISNIVVLEVHVSDLLDIETCQSAVDAAVVQASGRTSFHTKTNLFQGHVPKSLSDGLLYFVAPSNKSHSKRHTLLTDDDSTWSDKIIQGIEDLILPWDKWETEGYPIPILACDSISERQDNEAREEGSLLIFTNILASISLDEANSCVDSSGFRVIGQSELDKQLYLQTLDRKDHESSEIRVFGLDCEMVMSSVGSELARISLIQLKSFHDDKLETITILDALVKPHNPVKDYLTRYSGITASLLEPVTTRLSQIQVALQRILRPSDILVGHSLENDLMAAHFIHPRVVDTSLIFRHGKKRTKFSLRHISAFLLKRTIQNGSHCSEEDAVAALELAVRRACQGDNFSLPNSDERRSILERWGNIKDMKMASIGPPEWLQAHFTNTANGIHALGCRSVAECRKAVLAWTKGSRKLHLAWSHISLVSGTEDSVAAFEKMLVRSEKCCFLTCKSVK